MRLIIFCIVLATLIPGLANAQEYNPRWDGNEDGVVDSADLLLFQRSWHAVAPTPTPTPENEISIDLPGLPVDATPLVLVRIPAGSFWMGSNESSLWSYCYPCEQPVHLVNIGPDFYLGRNEVTVGQYTAFLRSTGDESNVVWDLDCPLTRVAGDYVLSGNNFGQSWDQPMVGVAWNGSVAFADWLATLPGGSGARLPGEAEWEYACKAGIYSRFSFGDSTCRHDDCNACDLDAYAWWCGNSIATGTKVVGQKLPNPFGLYDMHGNVMEWCEDDWHDSYTDAPANRDPWVDSPRATERVIRSGSWDALAADCRSTFRVRSVPLFGSNGLGFRVARDR
jgi:formylglycine-generating enzyme required for sulfatase activity